MGYRCLTGSDESLLRKRKFLVESSRIAQITNAPSWCKTIVIMKKGIICRNMVSLFELGFVKDGLSDFQSSFSLQYSIYFARSFAIIKIATKQRGCSPYATGRSAVTFTPWRIVLARSKPCLLLRHQTAVADAQIAPMIAPDTKQHE